MIALMRSSHRAPSLLALTFIVLLGAALVPVADAAPSSPVAQRPARLGGAESFRLLQQADSSYRAKHWIGAAELYARLSANDSTNGHVWQNQAWCMYQLERFSEASSFFQRAVALGGGRPGQSPASSNAYNAACCEARAGHRDPALAWLQRSLDMGYAPRSGIADDADLASLRSDPRFADLAHPGVATAAGRDAGWRSDLDYLVSEIHRLHAVYRTEPLPPGFDAAVASLRADLPRLNDGDIAVRLQGLLARLGDGHSGVRMMASRVGFHTLPLKTFLFPEGLRVFSAPAAYAKLTGRNVVGLGGQPLAVLLERLRPYVSRDNDMGVAWSAPRFLSSIEVLHALGCVADSTGVDVETEDPSGQRETVHVAPSAHAASPHMDKLTSPEGVAEMPLYLRHVDNIFWSEPLENGHVMYVQFNQVMDKPEERLAAFALRLRDQLAQGGVADVIVDVRHNNGGNAMVLDEFVRTLTAFDAMHPGRHLYVITGRATFSAAQVFINRVEAGTNAVFVGEPSSSRPDFVGEDTEVRLPFSGLVTTVSSRRHFIDGWDTRAWIAPTVSAAPTAADYFSGRDAALEAVLELVREGAKVPQ